MKLDKDERIEDLQCAGLKIIQNKNLYTFTSDSVILANFIKTGSQNFVVEIGAGSGVISVLLQAKCKIKKIMAFEIQKPLAMLCEKNIKLNALQEKIEVVCADAREFEKFIQKSSVDTVVCNPPYFKATNFKQTETKRIAKEEIFLSCEQLCQTASKMLKSGGAFYVCYPADRSAELVYTLQKHNLSTKQLFFTENGRGQVQTVFIKAVKNAHFGTKVMPNLVTNDKDGNYLEVLHTKYFSK